MGLPVLFYTRGGDEAPEGQFRVTAPGSAINQLCNVAQVTLPL